MVAGIDEFFIATLRRIHVLVYHVFFGSYIRVLSFCCQKLGDVFPSLFCLEKCRHSVDTCIVDHGCLVVVSNLLT